MEVTAGADTTGVDIQLMSVPFVRVSGKILGLPRSSGNAVVIVHQDDGDEERDIKPDGSFAIWRLDPGKYKLNGEWNGADGLHGHTASAHIEVAGANIDNIELRVVPDSDISGRVEFEDERAQQNPQKDASLRTVSLEDEDGGFAAPSPVSVDAGYTFHLAKVEAGKYHVHLSWNTAYVKSMRLGSRTVEGSLLDLTNGAGDADLTLVVAAATGSITGIVQDEKGKAAMGLQLVLSASDPAVGSLIRTTTTTADGTYIFINVPPGSYKIVSGEQDNGEMVELRDGDKVTKDLKAPPPNQL